ncbi:MAG TPA: copper transporter [Propionibacteriaceae bacterium]
MINFRYHIVSLMAVFLALSVGIVLGVSLRGPVDEGLAQQAEQDRQQVTQLRAELDQQNALDDYRDAWAERTAKELNQTLLAERTVAIVVMPDAPAAIVNDLSTAVSDAGGEVTHVVRVNSDVFDPAKAGVVSTALAAFDQELEVSDATANGARFGLALGRAVFGKQAVERDTTAADLSQQMTRSGLISVSGRSTQQAELALVVTAQAAEPALAPEVLTDHVEMDVALKQYAVGVVLAGPNSEQIDGTDVLAARNTAAAANTLSTVDVADLSSGVATTVMAGKEQLLGRSGHYGALSKADSPLPQLPVR